MQSPDATLQVENIITEPSGTSQIFIVYGRRHDKGALMQLNFETLHERRCAGVNAAGSDASDYEEWVPADSLRDGSCLMGRKVRLALSVGTSSCVSLPMSSEIGGGVGNVEGWFGPRSLGRRRRTILVLALPVH